MTVVATAAIGVGVVVVLLVVRRRAWRAPQYVELNWKRRAELIDLVRRQESGDASQR